MKIRELTVENYRGINDRQTIFISDFTSIVGKNDSGKSIIVNAIASFLDSKKHKITESDFNDLSKDIVFEFTMFDNSMRDLVSEQIKTKLKKEDGLEEFLDDLVRQNNIKVQKIARKSGSEIIVNISLKDYKDADFSNIYTKKDEELISILNKYSIEVPISGSGRNSKLEKIKHIKNYCKDHSIEEQEIWIEDTYKIFELLPAVELFVSDYGLEAGTSFKSSSVSEIKSFFDSETAGDGRRLSELEKDIAKEMSKEADSIKDIMIEYTSSLEEVFITPDIDWKKAIEGVSVKLKFSEDSSPIVMTHKGAGYRRLFMVARFRYLAEKNNGSDVVYLIEEPETFLHPLAQEDLLEALNQLAEENTVVVTTHSPVFAGSSKNEAIILCAKNKQSQYFSVKDTSNKDEFIKGIINELGIKPHFNLRDKFSKIMFVEGEDDVYFYNLVSKHLLGKELLGEEILVLPCGGDSVNSFINIEYFSKSMRPMYLIVDSDIALSKTDPKKVQRQKDIALIFEKKDSCMSYLTKKSTIENYFHPRAVERFLSLPANTVKDFKNDSLMKDEYKKINSSHSKTLSKKHNTKIFDLMTKVEFEEVIESELIDFLSNIIKTDE